jgi:hypothetical protein
MNLPTVGILEERRALERRVRAIACFQPRRPAVFQVATLWMTLAALTLTDGREHLRAHGGELELRVLQPQRPGRTVPGLDRKKPDPAHRHAYVQIQADGYQTQAVGPLLRDGAEAAEVKVELIPAD